MTRSEAIEFNKNLKMYMEINDKESEHKFLEENHIALEMGIKALEQIDKIKEIIAIDNTVIQEDVLKYKMICEVLE